MQNLTKAGAAAVGSGGGRAAMLAGTALAVSLGGGAAWAQEARVQQPAQVQEIIVTARQRDETLMEVPVAVTTVGGDQLAATGATDLTRIADQVPTMSISRASSGSGGTIVMRGISSSATDPGLEASVSVNVDGVQISRGYITQAAFFDLEQVEVLKGPQALFFGKNSPAGVISLHSAGPGNRIEGYLRGGYEFRANERFLEGAVGGPITDTLGVRLALRYSKMDGYLKNLAAPLANPFEPQYPLPGAVGNELTPNAETWVGRLTVEWRPTDALHATLKILGNHYQDNELTGYQQVVNCAAGFDHPSSLGFQDPFGDCKADKFRSMGFYHPDIVAGYPLLNEKGKPYTESEQWLASLRLDYEAGPVRITSVTGSYDLNSEGFGMYDYTVYNRFPGVNGESTKIITQELRAVTDLQSPLNFTVGAYYEDYKRASYTVGRGVGSVLPSGQVVPDPRNGATALYFPYDYVWSKTYSAFGQAIWDITPEIELAGGVRYTKEKKDADLTNIFVNQGAAPGAPFPPGFFYLPEGTHLIGEFNDDNWSPEVTLSWRPSSYTTLYAAYRSGYKSGGFSTTAVLLRFNTIPQLTFDSETADGFEVGYKGRLLDNRLTLTANAYRYKYDNLQRSSLDIATTSFVVRNAAAALVKGFELEADLEATDEITFFGALAYNKATYSSFPVAACYNGQTLATGCNPIPGTTASGQDLSGTPVSRAPELVLTGGFRFERPITADWGLGLTGDIKYSSSYLTQDDGDPRAKQDAFIKLNASVRLFQNDGPWEVSLIGRNLTNEWVVLVSTAKPGGRPGDIVGLTERPREVILQAVYRY